MEMQLIYIDGAGNTAVVVFFIDTLNQFLYENQEFAIISKGVEFIVNPNVPHQISGCKFEKIFVLMSFNGV